MSPFWPAVAAVAAPPGTPEAAVKREAGALILYRIARPLRVVRGCNGEGSWERYLMFTVLSRIVEPSVAWEMVPPPVAASPAVAPAVATVAAPMAAPVLLFGRFLPRRGRASD